MTLIEIPKHWTGDQALAVIEFIDKMSTAIWNLHEIKLIEAWNSRASPQQSTDFEDNSNELNYDDLPF